MRFTYFWIKGRKEGSKIIYDTREEESVSFSISTRCVYLVCFAVTMLVRSHILDPLFKTSVDYKPEVTLSEQSSSFQLLVDCVSGQPAAKCFQKFRNGITDDFSLGFDDDGGKRAAKLDRCFDWVAQEKRAHLVVLRAAECIFDSSNDNSDKNNKNNNKEKVEKDWLSCFESITDFLSCLVAVLYGIDWLVDIHYPEFKMEENSNENAADETEPSEPSEPGDSKEPANNELIESEQQIPDVTTTTNTEPSSASPPPLAEEKEIAEKEEPSATSQVEISAPVPKSPLRKARTDLNIHDPTKPIPSVLDYPTVDKRGHPLKRIFLPGRGWISTKAVMEEKERLYDCLGHKQVDTS